MQLSALRDGPLANTECELDLTPRKSGLEQLSDQDARSRHEPRQRIRQDKLVEPCPTVAFADAKQAPLRELEEAEDRRVREVSRLRRGGGRFAAARTMPHDPLPVVGLFDWEHGTASSASASEAQHPSAELPDAELHVLRAGPGVEAREPLESEGRRWENGVGGVQHGADLGGDDAKRVAGARTLRYVDGLGAQRGRRSRAAGLEGFPSRHGNRNSAEASHEAVSSSEDRLKAPALRERPAPNDRGSR